MKAQRNALIVVVLSAIVVVGLAATAAQAQGGKPEVKSAEAFGIIWDHGNGNANGNGKRPHGGSSPNLTYHGGPIRSTQTQVFPIFWGSSWSSPSDKQQGLDSFYAGVGTSKYVTTNSEYTNNAGTHVSTDVKPGSDKVDTSAAPSRAPSTADVLAEVANLYPSPTPGAYYPVYIDQPRGSAGYCAWHSSGTINGIQVQFGFFFNLDNDPGCNPGVIPNNYSQGTQALVNVSGHELSEMLTDPQLNAWFDSSGSENSDKCAWTFGPAPVSIGGTSWRIQGNWSNNAYNATQGYTLGCIDGNQ